MPLLSPTTSAQPGPWNVAGPRSISSSRPDAPDFPIDSQVNTVASRTRWLLSTYVPLDLSACTAMISATRRWLRRNRTNFAIGAGVLGVGYIAGQYVLSKISETRERRTADRVAREKYTSCKLPSGFDSWLIVRSLRRRFQQNQEDCTFTVLALLPTMTENILEALPVESITNELQQKKAERLSKTEGGVSDPSSGASGAPSATEDDGKSLSSFKSESYVHTSQMAASGSNGTEGQRKSKAQLWNELKINCMHTTHREPSAPIS